MKLGILKFCIPLDFEVLTSTSNSGVDDRYGFIRELIKRGHEIYVFTPLFKGYKNTPREERWITTDKDSLPKTVDFMKKIKYCPNKLPVDDFKMDVLIAEAGVGNIQFMNHYYPDKESPEAGLIRRFVHVINAHKGPVFYLHNDPSLPFYFRQLAGRAYPWGHKRNGYTNPIDTNRKSGWVKDSAWATHDEIFKDKTSIVITRCIPKNFEYMIDKFDVDRSGYKEFSKYINFEYIPPAYDYSICKGYKFQEKIKYPLFYSGGDRRRRIAFRKFYEEMGVPTYVSGKWKEEAMETFDGINFLGWLEDRRDLLNHLNHCGAVVQIQPKDASRMGWWTARTMEVPSCYGMSFIDKSIDSGSDLLFDKWFVLGSKEEAINKIGTFIRLSNNDRLKIIETQNAYNRTYFTWKRFTDTFIALCNKYLERPKIKYDVRKDYLNLLSNHLVNGFNDKPEFNSSGYIEELPMPSHTDLIISPKVIEQINPLPYQDIPL